MRFGRRSVRAAPATTHGEKERRAKAVQNIAKPRRRADDCGISAGGNSENNHRRVNGIAVAKANAKRPRMTVRVRVGAERAKEMLAIQPTIIKTDSVKS